MNSTKVVTENSMKNLNASKNQAARRILLVACGATLAMALMVSLPQPAHAQRIIVPPVPDKLQADQGSEVFLVGHAVGTQNYECQPTSTGFGYVLFTPQATLFNDDFVQLITHFFSPNANPIDPVDKDVIRATWESSRDTSTVWAKAIAQADHTTDPTFVEQGAIAWVLLDVVGTMNGPTGGRRLSETTQIQRLNTHGGLPPSTGCASLADVGTRAFVPYRADYFFYHGPDSDK
jgi:hypothetical protein